MKTSTKAMDTETRTNDSEWQVPDESKLHIVPPSSPVREEELRLEELDARLEELHVASNLVWLKQGLDDRDPVMDLRTKVESVRWMLRIAKHLKAHAREMLFTTIKSSLDQIERTVEMGVRASDMSQPYAHAHHAC